MGSLPLPSLPSPHDKGSQSRESAFKAISSMCCRSSTHLSRLASLWTQARSIDRAKKESHTTGLCVARCVSRLGVSENWVSRNESVGFGERHPKDPNHRGKGCLFQGTNTRLFASVCPNVGSQKDVPRGCHHQPWVQSSNPLLCLGSMSLNGLLLLMLLSAIGDHNHCKKDGSRGTNW